MARLGGQNELLSHATIICKQLVGKGRYGRMRTRMLNMLLISCPLRNCVLPKEQFPTWFNKNFVVA